MKLVRAYTGEDDESHLDIMDQSDLEYVERDGSRTAVRSATGTQFAMRKEGEFTDFHNAPRRQYVFYLTASVELGLGDGSTHIMKPGDVLLAEDTTGRGHTSRVVKSGISATVRLDP
jgi:quercetin dioxygenase-like cupin family protein